MGSWFWGFWGLSGVLYAQGGKDNGLDEPQRRKGTKPGCPGVLEAVYSGGGVGHFRPLPGGGQVFGVGGAVAERCGVSSLGPGGFLKRVS